MRVPGFRQRPTRLEADVAVLGSGLPALAAALELSRRGARVAVLGAASAGERPRGLGLALLGPGRPYARVARALGRSEARLVWAAGCENHLRLRALVDEARRDCGYAPRGSFLLATDRAEAGELAESEDMLRHDGFPGEFLDHYMLETRFDLSGFSGAYWAAEDAEVDAALLLGSLGERALAAGIAFEPGPVRAVAAESSVVSFETETGAVRAGAGLVATDGAAGDLLPELRPLLRRRRRAASARSRWRGPSCPPPSEPPTEASPGRAGRGRSCCSGSARPGISPKTPCWRSPPAFPSSSPPPADGTRRARCQRTACRSWAGSPAARSRWPAASARSRPASPSPRRAGWRTRS